MKERRQHKRLNIPLPVRVNVMNGSGIMALDLQAKDISYSGTFIPTLTSFPDETRFILDFTIPSDNLSIPILLHLNSRSGFRISIYFNQYKNQLHPDFISQPHLNIKLIKIMKWISQKLVNNIHKVWTIEKYHLG